MNEIESLTAKLAQRDRYIAALEKRVSDLLLRLPLSERYAQPSEFDKYKPDVHLQDKP